MGGDRGERSVELHTLAQLALTCCCDATCRPGALPTAAAPLLPPPPPPRSFKQESKQRTAVLRKLDFVDAAGQVLIKGRAACEIDTAGGWAEGWDGWAGG